MEIIAEQRLGLPTLSAHPQLRLAFAQAEEATRHPLATEDEKARIAAMVELCFEYERETEAEKKPTSFHTLEEIGANEELELPTQNLHEWETQLARDFQGNRPATNGDVEIGVLAIL